MPKDLQGRVICITGGSAGIGRATALACARSGMSVVVAARRRHRLEEVVKELEAEGVQALAVPCDVADKEQIDALVVRSLERFGRLDAVLANAGYGINHGVLDLDDVGWRRIFEVNFWGSIHLMRAAIPTFREQRSGHLLMTSSCLSRFSLPYYSAYCATKAAQTQVARSLRLELEPEGIDVSVVHPIATYTEFFEVSDRESGFEHEGPPEHAPKAFIQSPDKVARAIVKCLRKPVPEVWTSPTTLFAAGLMVMIPKFPDRIFRSEARRRRRQLAGQ